MNHLRHIGKRLNTQPMGIPAGTSLAINADRGNPTSVLYCSRFEGFWINSRIDRKTSLYSLNFRSL